eukprot:15716921-Heterocapsa_arctica.AAC.1
MALTGSPHISPTWGANHIGATWMKLPESDQDLDRLLRHLDVLDVLRTYSDNLLVVLIADAHLHE